MRQNWGTNAPGFHKVNNMGEWINKKLKKKYRHAQM